jgi:hypothetical protein
MFKCFILNHLQIFKGGGGLQVGFFFESSIMICPILGFALGTLKPS